ncbi:MAG: hypothetical protein HZB53_02145 [Chloroflexi bacterium]|nr:hypothetical protein [Chloroflexota bacterium]
MKKVVLLFAGLVALLPAAALAHGGGEDQYYTVLVPGELSGLFAVLLAALVLLFLWRRNRAPQVAGLALAILSGMLLYLSFPPFDLGVLAWVALVPMIIAQFRYAPAPGARPSRVNWPNLYQALMLFVVYALVFMHVFPPELPTGIETMVGLPIPAIGYVVPAVALVCYLLYLVGLPAGSFALHRRTGLRYFIIGPALAWMGLEQLRVLVQLGQGWARLPATQHANIPLIQLSTLGGQWLVGLIVVAANYALALLVLRRVRLDADLAQAVARQTRWAVAALAVALAGHLLGLALIGTPAPGPTVRVAAIQMGEDLGDSTRWYKYWGEAVNTWEWRPLSEVVLDDFEPKIREAAAQGAKVIALPEAALWVDPAQNLWLVSRATRIAKETGAYITFTFYLWNDPNSRNEVYTATPQGEWLGPYAKNHPIWYIGEYSITAGQYPVYQTPFGGLSNFTCYDNAYTDVASRLASLNAGLLTSSNHDWPEGAWGFYTQSIFRAAENRVAIVRADWRVGSVIIDPYGRVVASTKWDEREQKVLIADVPLAAQPGTFYTQTGDWLAYLGLAALVLSVLGSFSWPRRTRTVPQPA